MPKIYEVLEFLCPNIEYVSRGNSYKDIDWLGNEPAITEEQFENGLKTFADLQEKQIEIKATAKAELLQRLGITAEEAALLLG